MTDTTSSTTSSTASDARGEERYVSTRTIAAPAESIFAILSDPERHQETEPGDWVRAALNEDKITGVGQIFGVNMHITSSAVDYVMHNRVTSYEPQRVIAWEPGRLNDRGELDTGGWVWRYDLSSADAGGSTEVTLSYDWSNTPQQVRDQIGGLPPFPPAFLAESLQALERAVVG